MNCLPANHFYPIRATSSAFSVHYLEHRSILPRRIFAEQRAEHATRTEAGLVPAGFNVRLSVRELCINLNILPHRNRYGVSYPLLDALTESRIHERGVETVSHWRYHTVNVPMPLLTSEGI